MGDPVRNHPGGSEFSETQPPGNTVFEETTVDSLLAGPPPERALPPEQNPQLNRAAENIGAALGSAVGRVRSGLALVQTRQADAKARISENLSQEAEDLTAALQERIARLADAVEDKAGEFATTARERWVVIRGQVRRQVVDWRERFDTAREERPVELILGMAGAAFLLGFALRVWRSNHDYE